mgnify:CR=1 FL=1
MLQKVVTRSNEVSNGFLTRFTGRKKNVVLVSKQLVKLVYVYNILAFPISDFH